jgi:selenocysteine lyase/cysteine desulfurase
VAITGASNVTGFVPPIHQIAEWTHQAGALILVDCAQLAAHRPIDMGPHDDQGHLDFVCLSGHKIYAPYGTGALIGPGEFLQRYPPALQGGGTIEVVTTEEVYWADPPERNEAGSPNVVGAVALAASLQFIKNLEMGSVISHEQDLTRHILRRLMKIPQIQVFGSSDPDRLRDRLGVISFDVQGIHHAKIAAILGFEAGIGVRNGCFCAHPYLLHMMKVSKERYARFKQEALHHDRRNIPGLTRVSFGCYNTIEEIDYLIEWLERILQRNYSGEYFQERTTGAYYPQGYDPSILNDYLNFS